MLTVSFKEITSWMDQLMPTMRPLERALYRYHFLQGSQDDVIVALQGFQNHDGGFGHGIEPDFMMPASSPMATTVGLQILEQLKTTELTDHMIGQALDYLSKHYDARRMGWYAVNKHIDDAPHAPWWNVNEEGRCVIDDSWGNPSAEVLAYFISWHQEAGEMAFKDQLAYALKHFEEMANYENFHEIFCYIRLFQHANPSYQTKLLPLLKKAINQVVSLDEAEWTSYTAKPLDFVEVDLEETFDLPLEAINTHLDHMIKALKTHGKVLTTWTWGQFEDAWPHSQAAWEGILTLKALRLLKRFKRIKG